MPNHFMAEPFKFVSQMQHPALEINDHQVIGRRMSQRLSNLLFEDFVPPFKISNMFRFRHDSCASRFSKKGRAGAIRKSRGIPFENNPSKSIQTRPLTSHRRSTSPNACYLIK